MKLLVTGADGQVGRCLVEAGQARGVSVVALGRAGLDITVPESIIAATRAEVPDLIINAAAYTAVDKAESEPGIAHNINAIGAGNVAHVAHQYGVPVIHISTDYVFDGCKASAYLETDATEPLNVYGRSKLEGERMVAAAAKRHLIVRTAWVHSPFGSNFVKTMLRLSATRPQLGVVDDQYGTPTYAPHLAAAILDVALRIRGAGSRFDGWGIYHACGSGETTWCGLAREVFDVSARLSGPFAGVRPGPASACATPARRRAGSRRSCARLESGFGRSVPGWRVS